MVDGLLGSIGQGVQNFFGGFGGGQGMPSMSEEEQKYLRGQNVQSLGRMLMVLGMPMTAQQRSQAMAQMVGNMPDPTQQMARMQEMKLRQMQMEQAKRQQEGLANFGNLLQQGPQVVETPVPGAVPQQPMPQSGEEVRAPLAPITPTQQKLVSPLPGITGEQYQFLRTFGNDPAAAQEMYQKLAIENMKGADKGPADVQEYNFYRQQELAAGRQPLGWMEYQQALKKAGASSTTIQMPGDIGGDAKMREELAKEEGKRWSGLLTQGDKAASITQDMQVLDALIQDPGSPQGPVQGRLVQVLPGFSSKAAAFDSVVQRIAPNLRAPGSGSTSDVEFEGFLKSLPALQNRQNGNMIISDIFKQKASIDLQRSDIVTAWQNGDIDAKTARKQLSELNRKSILTPELRSLIKGADSGSAADPTKLSDEELLKSLGAK